MRLINGDCLIEMDKLIEEGIKVDAIICDPPYGTTACKWDSVIPFSRYTEMRLPRNKVKIAYEDEAVLHFIKLGMSYEEALQEFNKIAKEGMWERLNKLIKHKGAIVLFGGEPFSSLLRISNIKDYRYDWIWEKDKGANWMFGNTQPLKVQENICVFYKKQPTYNPQKTLNPKGESKRHLSKNPNKITKNVKDVMGKSWKETDLGDTQNYHGKTYDPKMLLPRSIQKFKRDARGKQHPTQKPVALMEYIIKTYTNEGETVLDFTCGSGSTGVACEHTNRNFIGIDNGFCEKEGKYKNWKWVDVTRDRVLNG